MQAEKKAVQRYLRQPEQMLSCNSPVATLRLIGLSTSTCTGFTRETENPQDNRNEVAKMKILVWGYLEGADANHHGSKKIVKINNTRFFLDNIVEYGTKRYSVSGVEAPNCAR